MTVNPRSDVLRRSDLHRGEGNLLQPAPLLRARPRNISTRAT